MIWCKENSYAWLPYGQLITKLLATFNVDTIDEVEDPINHMITYNYLKGTRVHIKHKEIEEDSSFNEEEE